MTSMLSRLSLTQSLALFLSPKCFYLIIMGVYVSDAVKLELWRVSKENGIHKIILILSDI